MSLPSMNFLHLTVSEIQPGQTFSRRPPTRPRIRTAWVKTIPRRGKNDFKFGILNSLTKFVQFVIFSGDLSDLLQNFCGVILFI